MKATTKAHVPREIGRRGRIRTCNRRIRNPMLYPFELRALAWVNCIRYCYLLYLDPFAASGFLIAN